MSEGYKNKFNSLNVVGNFNKDKESGFVEKRNGEAINYIDKSLSENGHSLIINPNKNMFGATHIHVNPFKVGDKEKRPVRMSFVTDINIFRLLVSFATNPSNIYVLVGEVYITMLSSSGNYTLKFLPSSRTNAHKQILDNVRLNVNKQNRKLKNAMLGISKLN